ncbi:MAG: PAS domain-containing protein [Elusimicrobia bacterium]|nr:PAS domain-containing protein [Elusimicrobiota bacterium]
MAEGIVAVDPQERVLLCNDSLSWILNRPPHEALGLPLWEVLRHREIDDMVARALQTRQEESKEISFPFPSEGVWQVRARAFPYGPSSFGAVLTFYDITNIRRLENIRKDFVANVSHELKTPLTALRAALETLLEGALEDPRYARDFLQTAQNQVVRLQHLIDDLLVLSRLEKGGPLPTENALAPLQPTLEKVIKTLEPMAQKSGIRLHVQTPPDVLSVDMTSDELTQVLLNLIDNAIKFNNPGGQVRVSAQAQGPNIEITIQDSGIGIPPEDQPRIFERFYRVDKARSRELGGTGLGLAIVKHIVLNRKGSVRVKSTPGQGSEFSVTLPSA